MGGAEVRNLMKNSFRESLEKPSPIDNSMVSDFELPGKRDYCLPPVVFCQDILGK